jgi:RsiW-degrading membrane proteinase PrsW (M82 family)
VHHPTGRRLLGFVGLFVLAVVLHAAWDTTGTGSSYVVLAVLSLGLLMVAMRQARRADATLPPSYGGGSAVRAGPGVGAGR